MLVCPAHLTCASRHIDGSFIFTSDYYMMCLFRLIMHSQVPEVLAFFSSATWTASDQNSYWASLSSLVCLCHSTSMSTQPSTVTVQSTQEEDGYATIVKNPYRFPWIMQLFVLIISNINAHLFLAVQRYDQCPSTIRSFCRGLRRIFLGQHAATKG